MPEEVLDKRIYLKGLHPTVTEEAISDRFKRFGTVTNVSIAKDIEGQCRGFGHFTIHTTPKAWSSCLSLYNGAKWKGSVMHMEDAKPDYMERKRKEKELEQIRGEKRQKKRARRIRWETCDGFHAKDMTLVTDRNVESRKGWRRGRYGRAIAIVRMRRPDGTRIVFDPSHYKNNLTKLYDIGVRMKHVRQLPMFYDEVPKYDQQRKAKDGQPEKETDNDMFNEREVVDNRELDDAKDLDEQQEDINDKESQEGTIYRGNKPMPEVSTEKHYEVNVNMKPLFGAQEEPFKLFGGDDDDDAQQEPRVLFADNEEEKELDTDTPAIREKIHFDLGVLFFFHADDPELMQKSCFQYDRNGVFQRTEFDRESYESKWKQQSSELGEALKKRQKNAVKKQRRMQSRGQK